MGKPIGIPRTGVFGLIDLVGVDLMPHDQCEPHCAACRQR